MKTNEILENIAECGGLDVAFMEHAANTEGISLKKYIVEWVKANYDCSNYVANKVAEYYC